MVLSYQFLPNIIFILAVVGIILIILRRLPAAINPEPNNVSADSFDQKLADKGLPTLNISKIKTSLKLWWKKFWNFVLEAKDLKPSAKAGYQIKKFFKKTHKTARQASAPQEIAAETRTQIKDENGFLEAIKKEPKNLKLYDDLGKFYLAQKNYPEAKDIYLYLTHHEAGNSDYHAKLALCFYQTGIYDQAVKNYETSLSLDSTQPNRYYNLGLCFGALEKWDEAVLAFEKAIDLEGKNAKFYLGLSNAYAKLGQAKKAKQATLKAEKLSLPNKKKQI